MGSFSTIFEQAIRKEVTKAETIGTKIAHTAVFHLASDAIHNSPIRLPDRWHKKYPDAPAGHYKNNWQIGINTRPEYDIGGADATGEEAKNRAHGVLFSNMRNGAKTIYLANNAKSISQKKQGSYVPDVESEGDSLSELESYAMAIEDGVGVDRDTWSYQLDDRGITAPGAVLGRATLNWWHHIQEAKYGD